MKPTYWWTNAVFYELYIDRFAGNLAGLIDRLDYIKTLGIDCIHLLPHYPSPMFDDGYDVSNYRDVRSSLGTLSDFTSLIQEAHKRNIRVLTDLVLNHVSEEHPWFVEARCSKNNSKRDFFLWSDTGAELADSTNNFPHLKPSNWIKNIETNDYYFTSFYPQQPDLNWRNPEVLQEMLAVMDFWIAIGVDGFRLDAAAHLIKKEGTKSKGLPETHAVLKQIRAHLNIINPDVVMLAEVSDPPEISRAYFGDGNECHLVYHFQMSETLIMAEVKGEPGLIDAMIKRSYPIPPNCQWAAFLRNHDELSLHNTIEEDRVLLFDYADSEHKNTFKGNKGLSMRLASIFKKDSLKMKHSLETLIKLPASPIIYYGEELGMENDNTIGTQKDTRRYVRGIFEWDVAEEEIKNPNSLFSYVKKLLQERASFRLSNETLQIPEVPNEEILVR